MLLEIAVRPVGNVKWRTRNRIASGCDLHKSKSDKPRDYAAVGVETLRTCLVTNVGLDDAFFDGTQRSSPPSCTSIVERGNLTMRMQIRRLTRLTNAFSKKWENLWAALCLHFAWYNFVRVHRTLRVTPAMEAGITQNIWDFSDLLFGK
jgi:hypothetical protein